jgi:radical SAM protein with 4Fe4S-binding SPASM domain
MNKIIVNQYSDQKYSTIFNQKTGVFMRIEDEGVQEPFWCKYGPELMDISITNWCDRGCSFCYKNSNTSGSHMSLQNYELILNQAEYMKVSQIALGGGNPNQHPEFCEFLRLTREYDIVPSYTTNGRGLSEKILETTREYCGAVAVSAYEPYNELDESISKMTSYGIKTNIHFLLTSKSIKTAISWLVSPPKYLEKINAIIFLNYKPVGHFAAKDILAVNSPLINDFFLAINQNKKIKVGFDSCSMTGVFMNVDVPAVFIECCEAARFSMYISEEMVAYPCSFMVGAYKGENILGRKIQDIWRYGIEFQRIRNYLIKNLCTQCHLQDLCIGGCPLYPEINFCEGK